MEHEEVAKSKDSTAGGIEQPDHLRHVRAARNALFAHLASWPFPISTVTALDALGSECTARGGDADVLDQLTFRLRQRLEQELAIIAVVRRARSTAVQEESA